MASLRPGPHSQLSLNMRNVASVPESCAAMVLTWSDRAVMLLALVVFAVAMV